MCSCELVCSAGVSLHAPVGMCMCMRVSLCPHACTRCGLGALAQELEGLVLVSLWWVYANSWDAAKSWGSVPWKLGVSGIHPISNQSLFSTTVHMYSAHTGHHHTGFSSGCREGPALLESCANSSRPFFSELLLLPDGKNQLLLALLKCTGEGCEAQLPVIGTHRAASRRGHPGHGCS